MKQRTFTAQTFRMILKAMPYATLTRITDDNKISYSRRMSFYLGQQDGFTSQATLWQGCNIRHIRSPCFSSTIPTQQMHISYFDIIVDITFTDCAI